MDKTLQLLDLSLVFFSCKINALYIYSISIYSFSPSYCRSRGR